MANKSRHNKVANEEMMTTANHVLVGMEKMVDDQEDTINKRQKSYLVYTLVMKSM